MGTFIISIVIIIVVIVLWRRIVVGIAVGLVGGVAGGLLWGFIGLLAGIPFEHAGDTSMLIGCIGGFFVMFVAGLFAKPSDIDDFFEQIKEGNGQKPTSDNSDKSNTQQAQQDNESKIIRCPSCKKKMRVRLPLQSNKGKCSVCSFSLNIKIDKHGNVRIDKATTENKSRKNPTVSDYFKVLEIESTATPNEVKAAYRKKIREYHPDRVASLGEKLKRVATEESKIINAAYSVLKSKGLAS